MSSPTACTICGRWKYLDFGKQQRIARETIDIYVRCRDRFSGMGLIRGEFEDLSFVIWSRKRLELQKKIATKQKVFDSLAGSAGFYSRQNGRDS